MICAFCNKEFKRSYRVSAAKAARAQYCSRGCAVRERAAKMNADFAAKFWARLGPLTDAGCREWTGRRLNKRYGVVDLGGSPKIAHRVAYRLATGRDPGEREVCHTCDNPPCCEPAHLWLGTHRENMRDMAAKGRTNPPIFLGEGHPGSKLKAADIVVIRGSPLPDSVLARQFGVTAANISRIKKLETWRHV